jgi:transposase-like protein
MTQNIFNLHLKECEFRFNNRLTIQVSIIKGCIF